MRSPLLILLLLLAASCSTSNQPAPSQVPAARFKDPGYIYDERNHTNALFPSPNRDWTKDE